MVDKEISKKKLFRSNIIPIKRKICFQRFKEIMSIYIEKYKIFKTLNCQLYKFISSITKYYSSII